MLYFYFGSDRDGVRAKVTKQITSYTKSHPSVVRISDAHALSDLESALYSGGMFSEPRVVVLEYLSLSPDLWIPTIESLPHLKKSSDVYVIVEEKVDAVTQKQVSKHADMFEKSDKAKASVGATTIFDVANAIKRGDKKSAWIALSQALLSEAPEAVHGIMFWGVKDMLLKARSENEARKAGDYVARLSSLPHESRRKGVELEYALEHFVLSIT